MLITLATLVIGALLFVGAMVAGVWWRQERIAYQPPAERPKPPGGVRRVDYTDTGGQPLYGYVVAPTSTPVGVLVAFHGNADLATWQIPWAQEIARRTGWSVLLAEYRGYGGLPGMPTYAGIQKDAKAAWLTALQIAHEHADTAPPAFALFGHSLGSAVAVELAGEIRAGQEERLVALLLQSPFTSARDMARIVSTRPVQLLWKLIARVHYDTRTCFDTIDVPIWIAHGARDWLVPVSMGRELFARTRVPGELLVVHDAGHNDVDQIGGDSYWRWVSAALRGCDRIRSLREPESIPRTEMSD